MQQYEVLIVYLDLTQYHSTASWWTSLELGQEAIYNIQDNFGQAMPMGDTPAKDGLARKMALENEYHTCRIYLMLAGILHPILCTTFIHSIRW